MPTVDYLFKPFIYSCLHYHCIQEIFSIPSIIFHFFFLFFFFHCSLGQDYFTLQFSIIDKVTTLFTFQCNNTANWDNKVDRKVNQHLVSATYLAETEVLRTGHIGKI